MRKILHTYFDVSNSYRVTFLNLRSCTLFVTRYRFPPLQHMQQYPYSYINKVYGLHRISVHGKHIHFFVMNNIFCTKLKLHRVFDLKVCRVVD